MVAKPLESTYDIDAVGDDLAAIAEQVRQSGRQVLLTRDGQPVAAIVSTDDAEAAKRARRARIEAALKEISAKLADVPLDEIERQVKLAIAEVRAGKTATP